MSRRARIPAASNQPTYSTPAAPRIGAALRRSGLCAAGCGQAVECGPLGWWPCCSKPCLQAWSDRLPEAAPPKRIERMTLSEWPPRQAAGGSGS